MLHWKPQLKTHRPNQPYQCSPQEAHSWMLSLTTEWNNILLTSDTIRHQQTQQIKQSDHDNTLTNCDSNRWLIDLYDLKSKEIWLPKQLPVWSNISESNEGSKTETSKDSSNTNSNTRLSEWIDLFHQSSYMIGGFDWSIDWSIAG